MNESSSLGTKRSGEEEAPPTGRRAHLFGFRGGLNRPCSGLNQKVLKILPIVSGCEQLDINPEEME